jgi:hypothetical protein
MFLSFLSLLVATALGLPQTYLQPERAVAAPQADALSPTHHVARAPMRPWKRTVSTGTDEALGITSRSSCNVLIQSARQIYVCEHVFWGGKCSTYNYTLGSDDCVVLEGKTSSVRPSPGFSCVFYKYVFLIWHWRSAVDRWRRNAVCRDFNDGNDSIRLTWPGSENLLVTEEGNWNDEMRAFQCFGMG